MRLFGLVFAIVAMGGAGTALAEAPPSMKAAHLNWKVAPTAREMARRFPAAAKQAEADKAAVTVHCLSNAFGNLTCDAVEESPAGLGFGEAAVGVMSKARVRSTDAVSPEGRRFTYNLKFGAWSEEERATFRKAAAERRKAPEPDQVAANSQPQAQP